MIKICFVCLGNICRSPMAEFIMKEKLRNLNLEKNFYIESKATSYEEEGNDIYYEAKNTLNKNNIPYTYHKSTPLEKKDYKKFDYFIAMDDSNVSNMNIIFNGDPYNKVYKLLDFADINKDIEDPWYTRNFQKVYEEIDLGCTSLISKITKQ